MLTIALEQMKFFAHHGLYKEEQVLGNYFVLDIAVSITAPEHPSELKETVDYEVVFNIASDVMSRPQPLLEQVVHDITVAIKQRFPIVRHSKIALRKQSPPFGGDLACSAITLEKQY